MKCEVSSFTDSKGMIGGKQNFKNGSCELDYAHWGVVCHPKPNTNS